MEAKIKEPPLPSLLKTLEHLGNKVPGDLSGTLNWVPFMVGDESLSVNKTFPVSDCIWLAQVQTHLFRVHCNEYIMEPRRNLIPRNITNLFFSSPAIIECWCYGCISNLRLFIGSCISVWWLDKKQKWDCDWVCWWNIHTHKFFSVLVIKTKFGL